MDILPRELIIQIMCYYTDVCLSLSVVFKLSTFTDEKLRKHLQNCLIRKIVLKDGAIRYKLNGTDLIHRYDDEPAAIGRNGTKIWMKFGKIHRDKDCAILYGNGNGDIWENGILKGYIMNPSKFQKKNDLPKYKYDENEFPDIDIKSGTW